MTFTFWSYKIAASDDANLGFPECGSLLTVEEAVAAEGDVGPWN
jgi:hypothetical protein